MSPLVLCRSPWPRPYPSVYATRLPIGYPSPWPHGGLPPPSSAPAPARTPYILFRLFARPHCPRGWQTRHRLTPPWDAARSVPQSDSTSAVIVPDPFPPSPPPPPRSLDP